MSKYIVYSKDGSVVRCETSSLEYHGEWLGACNVTLTISSSVPIDFQIGDYLDYRGERFVINYDPTELKQASRGSYGEAFVYDNIVFNSYADELTRCMFLDYVKSDNLIHYSSLPVFSFYAEDITYLADRIQVNLDRVYTGDEKWTVEVHPEYVNVTNRNISISNVNVWDALALVKSEFDANFIIRGRTITIGTEGIAVGNLFSYGKGNGLYAIEKSSESEQAIVTRLRAYGSTKNMPISYYKDVTTHCTVVYDDVTISDEKPQFDFSTSIALGDSLTDEWEANSDYYRVRVRIGVVTVTAKVSLIPDSERWLFTMGTDTSNTSEEVSSIIAAYRGEWEYIELVSGVDKSKYPIEYQISSPIPNNMAISNLMLPSFPNETLDPYVESENVSELGIREGSIFFDGSGDLEEIYPTIEGLTADDLLAAGIIVASSGALDEVLEAEQIADDGVPVGDEKEAAQATFTIKIKDVGFDINDYLSASEPIISMKNGMCGGREFTIKECEWNGSGYTLTCERVYDESIGLFFPYNYYNIASGDKFVLLSIEMPDVYIKAASQRLLTAATEWLSKNDYTRYTYEPKVDEIFMARQHEEALATGDVSIHDTIKEGDLLVFEDDDLGINGSIIIDTLSIKENENGIPTYEIVLREDKAVGTIQKIQNQIDSIVSGSTATGGGYNAQQIQAFIKTFGDKYFLRKDKEDRTEFSLGVGGSLDVGGKVLSGEGIEVGEAIDSMLAGKGTIIDANGRIQADRMELRSSLTVMEIIFNRLSAMESNYAFSESAKIESIEERTDSDGNTYYRLTFEKRWESDFHAFQQDDILYGQKNDLASGGREYTTSWMRCLEYSDAAANQVDVVLYADNLVPGGKNYTPDEMMKVIRRGNATNTDRQSYWYLSALDEKCFVWLEGVDAPILQEANYYMILGKLKELSIFDNLPINYNHSYMYARGAIIQDLFRVDFQGIVEKQERNRGIWSAAIADSASPYQATETYYDVVYHNGCKWQCLVSDTLQEPSYAATDWSMIEGDPNFYLTFESSEGWQFFRSQVDTEITAILTHMNEDVTSLVMADESTTVVWTRDSGNAASDNAWSPTYVDGQKHVIHLTVADMGSDWGYSVRKVKFTCTVYIQNGIDDYSTAENSITI